MLPYYDFELTGSHDMKAFLVALGALALSMIVAACVTPGMGPGGMAHNLIGVRSKVWSLHNTSARTRGGDRSRERGFADTYT